MVGQAVYSKGDFDIRGHKVNEHARAAAKSLTRMMQEMDRDMSRVGIFAEQKALQKQIGSTEGEIRRLQDRLLKWRWEGGEPSALQPAIRVEGRIWTGASHGEAERAMIEELGARGLDLSEAMTADCYGYIYRTPAEEAPAPAPFGDELLDPGLPAAPTPYAAAPEAAGGAARRAGRRRARIYRRRGRPCRARGGRGWFAVARRRCRAGGTGAFRHDAAVRMRARGAGKLDREGHRSREWLTTPPTSSAAKPSVREGRSAALDGRSGRLAGMASANARPARRPGLST